MRELKTESQLIRTTQEPPGLKRSKTSRTVAPASEETVSEGGELIEEKSLSPDIAPPPSSTTQARTQNHTQTDGRQNQTSHYYQS
ncbi:MAG: hypothetical protein HC936_15390 [Leptolyngbyaceae cyanobacterium SU_3_3]|nr:hypothetical protein [Leptolyngbyaceae cyanobacterium SU_3_3]